MFLIFSLNSWNSPSTSSSSRLKFSMLNISINKYIIILLWILLGFNSNIKFIKGENDLSANIKNRKYFDFVSTKANLKKGKINFHCRYIPQQGRIRGAWGYGPPPWESWDEGGKSYNSTFIHCKQKTLCYWLLEYNKIIHLTIIKGETLNWRESIKDKVEEYKYSVDREFTVVEFVNLYLSVKRVRRDRMLLLWKLNI